MTPAIRPHGRVLVVDDDPLIAELIVGTLSEHGYAMRVATDAREALQILRRETPDVVLLDVHLPDVSGYQLCQSIREDFGDAIGVILISGERKESLDRSAGLLLGADDYLVKPFALDELLARVHRLARRSRPLARTVAEQLTRRELQILRSLSTGMDHLEIAHHLVITPKTVEKHIEHILLKLGVHSRAQAIALAFQDEAPMTPTLIELRAAATEDAVG
jgi:DNA-binding response OmpR family regulator